MVGELLKPMVSDFETGPRKMNRLHFSLLSCSLEFKVNSNRSAQVGVWEHGGEVTVPSPLSLVPGNDFFEQLSKNSLEEATARPLHHECS